MVATVEAIDEVGHGLVSASSLHLEEGGLAALALPAREKAVLHALFLDHGALPVRPQRLECILFCLLALQAFLVAHEVVLA